jgi:hypothetical protein
MSQDVISPRYTRQENATAVPTVATCASGECGQDERQAPSN